jgi:dihydrofolate reductase
MCAGCRSRPEPFVQGVTATEEEDGMRRITVVENLSLDGVMQAPGGAEEDTSGGFERGGWFAPYTDHVVLGAMNLDGGAGELLLGRRTYDQFASFWPQQGDNPFTPVLNKTLKHVVTGNPDGLDWENSTPVAVGDLAALKREDGPDLTVLGSGRVVAALREGDLVDAYTLVTCPLVLGRGKRLFEPGAEHDLRLVDSRTATTGAIVATYEVTR